MQIEWKQQNDLLHIAVTGRIDSVSSAEFENSIHQALSGNDFTGIILDFDRVSYVSSSGLRVLLKLRKEFAGTLQIVNVSSEVYGVFSVTRFSDILDIERKMRRISVQGCDLIGTGTYGRIYRLDEDTIIKTYVRGVKLDDIRRECDMAKQVFLSGIPTAISYDVVETDDDAHGVVFEMLDADLLCKKLVSEPENFDELMRKYVALLKQVHTTDADEPNFHSIKDIYLKNIGLSASWYSKEEMDALYRLVDAIPDTRKMVHGEFHGRNIMIRDGEFVLIDLAEVSYGHPIFDLLSMGSTQINLVRMDPRLAEEFTKMPRRLIERMWNRFMSLYFGTEDQKEVDRITDIVSTFARLRNALTPAIAPNYPDRVIRESVEAARAALFPRIGEMVEIIRGDGLFACNLSDTEREPQ